VSKANSKTLATDDYAKDYQMMSVLQKGISLGYSNLIVG